MRLQISFLSYIITIELIILITKVLGDEGPGTRHSHCMVTYQNKLYLFGGSKDWYHLPDQQTELFYSASLPFTTDSIPWKRESSKGAIGISDGACVVEPNAGFLIIFGGRSTVNQNSPIQPLQWYNFKKKEWNQPDIRTAIPPELEKISIPGPRAVLIEPNVFLIWTAHWIYPTMNPTVLKLDISKEIWKLDKISNPDYITNTPGIANIKSNTFVFGGQAPPDSNGTSIAYIYNEIYGWLSPQSTFSSIISDAFVGSLNEKLYIVVTDDGEKDSNKQIPVIPFDLTRMEFDKAKIPSNQSGNLTSLRNRASYAQFSNSDAVLIYGGIPPAKSDPLLGTLSNMIIFNMTTQSWTNQHDIVNITQTDFSLGNVNGHDLNIPLVKAIITRSNKFFGTAENRREKNMDGEFFATNNSDIIQDQIIV
ncbi:hypothetical protein G9A89_008858 [Geosiphon pyriformis]|nr:hypothetical protein G9A89_008858 [Geosiphon pyriformis]